MVKSNLLEVTWINDENIQVVCETKMVNGKQRLI